MDDAAAYCERLVREHDRDRFLSALFAPARLRPRLHALYAFDIEIDAIATRVRQPLAGEIRLQWWRDVIEGLRGEEGRANPVAEALLATIAAAGLPAAPLMALLEARAFDVYDDPMESVAQFDAWGGATAGAIIELAARCLAEGNAPSSLASAVREAGIAIAYARSLRGFAFDSSRGRLFLPGAVFETHGVSPEELFAGQDSASLRTALDDICSRARAHHQTASAALRLLAPGMRPAFLPLALVPPVLDCVERRDFDPFRTPVEVPSWRRQWRLWRAARGW